MKLRRYISLCFIMLAFIMQARTDIAVLNLDAGVGLDASEVEGLQGMLITELHNAGSFNIIERSRETDLWDELSRRSGSKLTAEEIKRIGTILSVDAIVVGVINYQVRERTAADVQTGMSKGEYNVDIRMISVKDGKTLASGGDVQKKGETTRSLMKRIARQLIGNYYNENDESEADNPIELYGYLTVFPKDLGMFTSNPKSFIDMINRQAQFGYNNWRLPDQDELALMMSNRIELGLKGSVKYATVGSDFLSGVDYGVRLVRSAVMTYKDVDEPASPYIKPESKDFGTIPMLKREVQTSFSIVNPTSSAIKIRSIKCNSSNVFIGSYNDVIMPGESVSVSVKILTNGRQGLNLQRAINILLDDDQSFKFVVKFNIQ